MRRLKLTNGTEIFGLDRLTGQYIYNEIYRDQVYLRHGVNLYSGATVFDIGANIGLFTKYCCEHYLDLRIFAFEPVPAIFTALQANLTSCRGSLNLFQFGLGEQPAEIEINFYPKVSGDSAIIPVDFERKVNMFLENFDSTMARMMPITRLIPKTLRPQLVRMHRRWLYRAKKIRISLSTISTIIDQHQIEKIDLIKLDAENYEWNVLMGIRQEHWPRIRQFAMEIHEHIPDGVGLHQRIKELLLSKGYNVHIDLEDPMNKVGIYSLWAWR